MLTIPLTDLILVNPEFGWRFCFALGATLGFGVLFTYGDTLSTFLDVKQTGWFIALFAISNFAGALLLGRLFDKVGRIPMISGTYILSGLLLGAAGFVLGDVTAVTLTIIGAVVFFFASAGASAAYLTASEVFPLETRALCIAFSTPPELRSGASPSPCISADSSTMRPKPKTLPGLHQAISLARA